MNSSKKEEVSSYIIVFPKTGDFQGGITKAVLGRRPKN
jgi:hypothetical protein